MLFPVIVPSASISAISLANSLMSQFNQYAVDDASRFKNFWLTFWDQSRPVEEMQALLDALATNVFNDNQGNPTNAWIAYYTAAISEIADIQRTLPNAFADASLESMAVLQPTGQPYQKFMTPGWYYTFDGTKASGIAVSSPCVWS